MIVYYKNKNLTRKNLDNIRAKNFCYKVNPVKIIRNNFSFIVTLTGVVTFLTVLLIVMIHPVYHDLILVNMPYLITIMILSLIPLLVIKKLHWYPEPAPRYTWALLFLITGFYYSFTGGPNLIGFLMDLITLKISVNVFLTTFFGLLAISGIFAFYYFLMAFKSAMKDNLFSLKVDVKSYIVWVTTYLIYLNALISIINPVFRRPF